MDAFKDGLKIMEDLPPSSGDRVEIHAILADIHEGIGVIWAAFSDWESARGFFRREAREIDRLIELEPSEARWQRMLARVTQRMADYVFSTNEDQIGMQYELALSGYSRVASILEAMVQANSIEFADLNALAWAHRRVGDSYSAIGDFKSALKQYRLGIAVAQRLARITQEVVEWQNNLSALYTKEGAASEAVGNFNESLISYKNGLEVATRLLPLWERNPNFLREVVQLYEGLGDVSEKLKDFYNASTYYREGAKLAEHFLNVDVGIEQRLWANDLHRMYVKSGAMLLLVDDKNSGILALRRSLEVSQILISKWPQATQSLKSVVESCFHLASAGDDSRNRWREVIKYANGVSSKDPLSEKYAMLVHLAEAKLKELDEQELVETSKATFEGSMKSKPRDNSWWRFWRK